MIDILTMFGEELDLNTSILLFCRLSFIIIAHFYSNFKIPMNDIFDNNFCKKIAKKLSARPLWKLVIVSQHA